MSKDERANPVRTGEELPIVPLVQYLHSHLPDLRGDFDDSPFEDDPFDNDRAGEIRVAQFGRGYSNLTYLLGVGEREFVLRRPPLGANIASAHDMGREVKVLRGLGRVYAYVPRVLAYCDDSSVIGAPFYLMERLHGVVLRAEELLPSDSQPPANVPGVTVPEVIAPEIMAKLASNVIENLATIHALDYEAAGLGDLGRPLGYVGRQVQGWTKRFYAAQSKPLPDLEAALRWLADHQPPEGESGAALIHNDYKYDNLILDGNDLTRLVAVLDWEMCTLGDPLLDLGTTLGYWVEPNDPPALVEMFGLTTLPGNPNRAEVVERYVAASAGQRASASFNPLFCYVYGLAKIGVILQQIHHRYEQGMSHDERFARLGGAVAACGLMAREAIRQQRISGLF